MFTNNERNSAVRRGKIAIFLLRNRAGRREVFSHYSLPPTHHIFNNKNTILFE